jgi:hypothetical protein
MTEDLMTETFDVIAAFADGERVDSDALKSALSTAEGREYLVDLLALRQVVQATEPGAAVRPRARFPRLRWAAAAALLLALGGALIFTWSPSDRPPAADRIVKLERGLDWRGN